MNATKDPNDGPATADEFEEALGTLLQQAHRNGVDVEGGWEFGDGTTYPSWGIEIYAVSQSTGGGRGEAHD